MMIKSTRYCHDTQVSHILIYLRNERSNQLSTRVCELPKSTALESGHEYMNFYIFF